MGTSADKDHLGKALDISVRLAAVAMIVYGAFRIFKPFLLVVIWAVLIAVTLFPVYRLLNSALGGRRKLSGALVIIVTLAAVLVPVILLTDSLLDATVNIVHKAQAGTLVIPAPTEQVKSWPVIGEKVYGLWYGAYDDLAGTAQKLQPQLGRLGERIVSDVGGLGKALLQTVLAVILAGILMVTSVGGAKLAQSIAVRLGGETGPPMVLLMVGTVRSVVKGVVLVALIQGLLSAIGMVIARVPGFGLWALIVTMLAIMQLSPIIILGPIAVWVFANGDGTAVKVFFVFWTLLVTVSDNLLKPLLLGRGVKVPMLVLLIGAIGGMLQAGLTGLFIGPVVLAVFHEFFMAWVREGDENDGGTAV